MIFGLILFCLLISINAFHSSMKLNMNKRLSISPNFMGLDSTSLEKLEDMKAQYDRLSAVVSPVAEAEMKTIEDLVEKYKTLKEIKVMLGKLRSMWKSEASERRRNKQLSSFMKLHQGRVEIETIIADKLGVSLTNEELKGVDKVEALDAQIATLEAQLTQDEIILPEGMSTREARFGVLP